MGELGLAGKTALVTGAASGIGRAIAELFAEQGAAVCLVDLEPAGLEEVKQGISRSGGSVVAVIAGALSR